MLFKGTHIKDLSKVSIILILAGFVIIGSSVFFFLSLAEEVMEKEKFIIDATVNDFIASFNTPWLQDTMGYITEAGSVIWLSIASVILFIYLMFFSKFSRWVAISFAINMIGISGLTKGLKLLFERQRPEVLAQFDGTGFSFPSGHSTGAITFYGFIIYLILISPLEKKWKWTINSLLAVVIFLVAFSRVFLSVHYVTDIAAGLAIGLTWLFTCITALELTIWRQRRRKVLGRRSR
ncbi:phosphatase PAP2 family protein [Virgibacillus kekensis]|uniref:Phosphatase PAP2 family protein n=1 Tax=Virgibacillus kekensis TaxID=202261 RepID=A0ABV9DLI6_9BACI